MSNTQYIELLNPILFVLSCLYFNISFTFPLFYDCVTDTGFLKAIQKSCHWSAATQEYIWDWFVYIWKSLDPLSLTALHSVVNHCGRHSPISHCWTAEGLSRWAHSLAGTTVKSFPIFWTQMMSRRCVPFPHGTLHWNNKESVIYMRNIILFIPTEWMPYHLKINK